MNGYKAPINLYKKIFVINIEKIKDNNLLSCKYSPLYFPDIPEIKIILINITSRVFKIIYL